MRIYIDERERILYEKLLEISAAATVSSPIEIIKKVLVLGDIVLEHSDGETALLIERKSIQDLLASIRDSRYEEQSYRLIHSSGVPRHNIMYLIEGIMNQVTNPKDRVLIYSSMTSLNHYKGFSIFRTASVQETAEWIWQTASKIHRNRLKNVSPYHVPEKTQTDRDNVQEVRTDSPQNICMPVPIHEPLPPPSYSTVVKKVKKDNITPENWMEIALCQIPGISSISAASIVLKFKTLENLIKSLKDDPDCLKGIYTKSTSGERKLSSAVVASIHKYIGTNVI
jgi:ERCC4-type nuclease